MSARGLIRPDLRAFAGYLSARKQNGTAAVMLNANEAALPQAFDDQALHRYPEPQPQALKDALCRYYGVEQAQLLVSRGSDEAIDLLVRAVCTPGRDRVGLQSPTFGMYAVCARLHACETVDVPLIEGGGRFTRGIPALIEAVLAQDVRLLFLCSPANPTGQDLPSADLERLLTALQDRCLVVVDEAYGEYSTQPSATRLLPRFANLAVLKTLSKAHALAGARIGAVMAAPELIAVLKACQAPYPISAPSARTALQAFSPEALARTQAQVAQCLGERAALAGFLRGLPMVRTVFDSDANFLLVRFADAEAVNAFLIERGIVVRGMAHYPAIADCLRISIGTPADNAALRAALTDYGNTRYA